MSIVNGFTHVSVWTVSCYWNSCSFVLYIEELRIDIATYIHRVWYSLLFDYVIITWYDICQLIVIFFISWVNDKDCILQTDTYVVRPAKISYACKLQPGIQLILYGDLEAQSKQGMYQDLGTPRFCFDTVGGMKMGK